MVYGYANKILHANLTTGELRVEEPPPSFYRRYLGGQGFIAYYLLKEIPPLADPLGPENRLIFAGGAYTGVPFAGAGRSAVGAKSPLTGGFGEADVGGFFGSELKHAGFDAVVVSGCAPRPVYLWIHNGVAELRPAEHIWGKTVLETRQMIVNELKDEHIRLAMIGPGGEKLVRFACVINDLKHAAGRTGTGAVMGSKNLKAVVARGTGKVEVSDPEGVKKLAGWMRDHWQESAKMLADYGSAGNVNGLNAGGVLPTRNFIAGTFEGAEKLSGETMTDTILMDTEGCFACPVRCKRVVKVETERLSVDPAYGGPEYETIGAFGSNCGIDDLESVAKAHELCNAYSIDTISAGGMISFMMECYENGLITKEDTGGLELKFGNADAMVELTRQMCVREGFGALLGEGPDAAIAKFGPETARFAMAVKNQYFPMHEGRARHGQALGYAVSPTGADHMHNIWDNGFAGEPGEDMMELGLYEPTVATDMGPSKVRAYIQLTSWTTVHNHLGNCMYIPWSRQQMAELLQAITGWHTNLYELLRNGERSLNLARVFNLREGLTRADDRLPVRMSDPLPQYPGVSAAELQEGLTLYYSMMGWDPQTGVPTIGKLLDLDIAWAADALAGL
jgi:aldehyde:ferredoxin oxidoreductase